MPIFEFEAPNGKRYRVEAPDEKTAKRGFAKMVGQSPKLFSEPGVAAALGDLEKRYYNKDRKRDATSELIDSYTLGVGRHVSGGIDAGITALQRAIPGGSDPDYTPGDAYKASRLLEESKSSEYRAKHPLMSTAADVTGALAMPGAKQVGKFIVGKTAPALAAAGKKVKMGTRAAQTLRASGVAGAQTGALAANTAKPGEEVERGTTAAVTGALLAPVAGLGAGLVAKAAPPLIRTGQKIVGPMVAGAPKGEPILTATARAALQPPTVDVTSAEKLAKVLRREGLTPDAVRAAQAAWDEAGGISPNLIDILKDAGASPGVLRLLQRSGAQAPARVEAAKYAQETVEGVQKKALDEVGTLPTGEPRTPTQIRADLDARATGVDTDLAAAMQEPPAPPRPKESGAAQFADELNRLYDTSQSTYQKAYTAAENAKPEAAVVDDAEVRPLFAKLEIPQTFDEALPGVAAVKKYLEGKKRAVAPGDPSDWPEGEVLGNTTPLTMLELQKMRQVLNHYASNYADEPGGALASRLKGNLDAEIDRLVTDNKLSGDPAVVDLWKAATEGYRQHQKTFGEGLAAKLTERKPDGSRKVPDNMAAETVFTGSLNKTLNELGESLDIVSPNAVRALQEELYGRVKLSDLPALRETTGGKRLLPDDLTEAAMAVPPANLDAEAAAAARKAALDAERAALETGEKVLETPSEAFAPAVEGLDTVQLPLVGAGAKQAVVDTLENPAPEATAVLRRLMGERASKNLGTALGDENVSAMQARLRNIEGQARNAQELELATGSGSTHESPLVENIGPYDIVNPKRGIADLGLILARLRERLSPEEYLSAVKLLTQDGGAGAEALLPKLLERYPAAKRAMSPALVRGAGREAGDADELERMRLEYGL